MPARPGDPIDPKPPLSLKTAPIRIGFVAADALAWPPNAARSAIVPMRMRLIKIMSFLALTAVAGVAVAGSVSGAAGTPTRGSDIRIVTVVKVRGLAWFGRMREGIRRFADRTGVDATMTAAGDASPRKQAAIIRRLIGERPDAITVVPNSPRSLERVLARARRAGIVVVTHEASNQRNTDVDIEPFDNAAFGAHLMDSLGKCMGGSGTYAAFVGHRSAQSHMEWVRGALAAAKLKFPGIRRIGRPIESREDAGVAYRKAKALLAQHPDIEGFEGSSAVDVAGIGRAVREAGRQDTTCVMGTSTPRTVGSRLRDGSVDRIFLWDPAVAGRAQDKLALRLIRGRRVGPALDLGLPGYRRLRRIAGSPHGLHGSAWIDIDRTNAGKFPF
jgi:simple sugar transport system substrate-binding protein